jgi:hypothetical protein
MFALDADNGIAYYGVNGIWLNGEPGKQGGTELGKRGDALVPFVTLSGSSRNAPVGDRWIANFGSAAYRFPIPAGYGAYGTTVPVRSTSSDAVFASPQARVRSPLATVDGFVSATFQEDVPFGNRHIPLPEGNWIGLAIVRDAPGFPKGSLGILGRLKNNRVSGLVVVSPTVSTSSNQSIPADCANPDNLASESRPSNVSGQKRCWWIHYVYVPRPAQNPFSMAESTAQAQGAVMPVFFLTAGFSQDDGTSLNTVTYYFDPEEEGIRTPTLGQSPNPWQRDELASSPDRASFVHQIEEWARGWSPIIFAYR